MRSGEGGNRDHHRVDEQQKGDDQPPGRHGVHLSGREEARSYVKGGTEHRKGARHPVGWDSATWELVGGDGFENIYAGSGAPRWITSQVGGLAQTRGTALQLIQQPELGVAPVAL